MDDLMFFRSVFDSLDAGIAVFDRNGDAEYINQSGLQYLRMTWREFIKQNIHRPFGGKMTDVCIGADVYQLKTRIVKLNSRTRRGRTVRRLITAMPLFDAEGALEHAVVQVTDLDTLRGDYTHAMLGMPFIPPAVDGIDSDGMIIGSAVMRQLIESVQSIAETDSSVLLTGESGTGKEVLANYIHRRSPRAGKEMIEVNCASLPRSLLESELFGYEKGAFTGALASGKPGLVEMAEGSTLFLDEVNSIPLSLQAKLLRMLDTKTVKRVGSVKSKKVNFRVIAATNADLLQCVKDGTFRADLYYRLNVLPVNIPPLRERRDDIVPLAKYYLGHFCEKYDRLLIATDELYRRLEAYTWPGNVRELKNIMEWMVVTAPQTEMELSSLPDRLMRSDPQDRRRQFDIDATGADHDIQLQYPEPVREIVGALARNNGSRDAAAAELGISRRTLQYRLKKYNIRTQASAHVFVDQKCISEPDQRESGKQIDPPGS